MSSRLARLTVTTALAGSLLFAAIAAQADFWDAFNTNGAIDEPTTPLREPFVGTVQLTQAAPNFAAGTFDLTIPEGRRFVLETFSCFGSLLPTPGIQCGIALRDRAVTFAIFAPTIAVGGIEAFAETRQVRIYVESGEEFEVTVASGVELREFSASVSISGYVEDVE